MEGSVTIKKQGKMQRIRNAKPTKIDPVEKAKECQTKAERKETKKKVYQNKPDRSGANKKEMLNQT